MRALCPPFIAAAGLALLAGCATPRERLCIWQPRKGASSTSPKTADDWFALLLHGYDSKTGAPPHQPLDCMGGPVFWMEPEAGECAEPGPRAQLLPPQSQLTADDLVIRP